MMRNLHFVAITLVFILGILLLSGCQRKVSAPTVTNTRSTPTVRAPGVPVQDDRIPMNDPEVDDEPQVAQVYAPTEYVELPLRKQSVANAIPKAANGCEFVGEVWDFENEGGCQRVVETSNGYLLSIISVPQGYYLEAGSRIRFGFNYDTNSPDDCTLANASIRITCLQLLRSASGFPRPMICRSYDQPSQWIHELIQDLSATYVTRFPWKEDRVVYLFETPSGQYLYDCRGFILCQPQENCLQYIDDFNTGVQIYAD